jgi:uncharacterized protein YebE (UPF0316 family)
MLILLQAAITIFALRLLDAPLYTMRILMVSQGRKALAMLFAFFQSFIFINTLRLVFTDLDDMSKIIGYAAGFATGMVIGMFIEAKLALGFTHLRIISSKRGAEIIERLRREGYAVTEIPARGQDGTVTLLNCSVLRKQTQRVTTIIDNIDPQAFITAEAVRPVRRGFWHK